MSSQNNKSRQSNSPFKKNTSNTSSQNKNIALSKASHLALLGSHSDLNPDQKTNNEKIFVSKSELASFKANSPTVKMNDLFFKSRIIGSNLPSLFLSLIHI